MLSPVGAKDPLRLGLPRGKVVGDFDLVKADAADHGVLIGDHRTKGAQGAFVTQDAQTAGDGELMTVSRYFEIWMLKLAGFFPAWRNCSLCEKELAHESAVYLTSEGAPQCADCSQRRGEELSRTTWEIIQNILTQSPEKFLAAFAQGALALVATGRHALFICLRLGNSSRRGTSGDAHLDRRDDVGCADDCAAPRFVGQAGSQGGVKISLQLDF